MTPERMLELAARFKSYDLNERRAKCLKLRNMALCLEREVGDCAVAVPLRFLAQMIEDGR